MAGRDKQQRKKTDRENNSRILLVSLFVIVATLAVYWQVGNHPFVYFDDRLYVTENRYVLSGLRWENITWAFDFSEKDRTYWHPITWISHMADVQLWGLDAGMHHITNLFFHIVNVLLVFFVFRFMTGAFWKSAFVASLFALHPINVDTVAWVAERKNLLSTFFWLLVMLSYFSYVKRPGVFRYVLVLIAFILGLLSKPMLVTLPFVLLLMDCWPLGRIRFNCTETEYHMDIRNYKADKFKELIISPAVLDKVPLILISFVSIYFSTYSLQVGEAVISLEAVPMLLRIENAVVTYVSYLGKVFWPYNLAVYYPYPDAIPLWKVGASVIFLAAITVWAIKIFRRHPYILVGWLWFAGTLVPVSGLMQGGLWPAMADRWGYVPLIGVFIMIAWGVPELIKTLSYRRLALGVSAGAVLMILLGFTWAQIGYWKDSVALFSHALDVTDNNDTIHFALGSSLMRDGKFGPAIEHFSEALRINPRNPEAYSDLGLSLAKTGKVSEGMQHLYKSIEINPQFPDAYNNLGVLLLDQGNIDEAVEKLSTAIELRPDYGEAYSNLGLIFARQGKEEDAVKYFYKAVQLSPYSPKAHSNIALALLKRGELNEAISHYEEALRLNPELAEAHNGLGIALMRRGDFEGAQDHFRQVLRINPGSEKARRSLERAVGAQKRFEDTAVKLKQAIKDNPDNALLYVQLGDLYHGRGSEREAVEYYQRALSVQTGYLPALGRLAFVYGSRGEDENALDVLRDIIELQPDNAQAYYNIACIYSRQGRNEESAQWLKGAVDKGFDDWDLLKTDKDLDNIRGSLYYRELMDGK